MRKAARKRAAQFHRRKNDVRSVCLTTQEGRDFTFVLVKVVLTIGLVGRRSAPCKPMPQNCTAFFTVLRMFPHASRPISER